jgi:hypothetical protein
MTQESGCNLAHLDIDILDGVDFRMENNGAKKVNGQFTMKKDDDDS